MKQTRYYDRKHNRLVYIGSKASDAYWDEHWSKSDIVTVLKNKRLSRDQQFVVNITKKYLAPGSKIIEGGSGVGDKVKALHEVGYLVTGVDFAKETVSKVRLINPDLDIVLGDIKQLQFDNSEFDGYWSLGVIEHFFNGFDDIVSEMRRVLKVKGYLFLTVPIMSNIRKVKSVCGMYPNWFIDKNDDFYQYALNKEYIVEEMQKHGFLLVNYKGWSGLKGLKDEIAGTKIIVKLLYKLAYVPSEAILSKLTNHMGLFVFTKT